MCLNRRRHEGNGGGGTPVGPRAEDVSLSGVVEGSGGQRPRTERCVTSGRRSKEQPV